MREYEIRCPVHGFINLNDWERDIVSQPAFQRLRRIRQLAWTDQVYPGAMHTRFEHSLGVMHIATKMFDAIVKSSRDVLEEHNFDEAGIKRDRVIVRLTALLHDVGHSPFSHAAEDLFPLDDSGRQFQHEAYSAAIIRQKLRESIESHPANENYKIRAEEIAGLLEGSTDMGRLAIWSDVVSGQMDADRIDYLIRDSLHAGVEYGRFDWKRLLDCLVLLRTDEDRGYRLGVTEGGFHAAEALVLARYFMFTQVYFHKTRVSFNHHLHMALKVLLPEGVFPKPDGAELDEFLKWDDWRVLGMLSAGQGDTHGQRLANRDHFREVFHSSENPTQPDLDQFEVICDALRGLDPVVESAQKSWYKVDDTDIPVRSENPGRSVRPLSGYSKIIAGLHPIGKKMIFCRSEDKKQAQQIVEIVLSSSEGTPS